MRATQGLSHRGVTPSPGGRWEPHFPAERRTSAGLRGRARDRRAGPAGFGGEFHGQASVDPERETDGERGFRHAETPRSDPTGAGFLPPSEQANRDKRPTKVPEGRRGVLPGAEAWQRRRCMRILGVLARVAGEDTRYSQHVNWLSEGAEGP